MKRTINEVYEEIKQKRDNTQKDLEIVYGKANDFLKDFDFKSGVDEIMKNSRLVGEVNAYTDIVTLIEESGVLEQLAEKNKEIEKLKGKPIIETDRETGTMKIDNIEFNVEQTKAISHLLEAFEKKVIEDVCNKIKEFTEENWDYDDFTYFLNKIEKGEE